MSVLLISSSGRARRRDAYMRDQNNDVIRTANGGERITA
jgi:hypothetical protein